MKKSALIAIVGIVTLVPATGEAAQGQSKKSCPKQAVCVWTKANFEGKRLVVKEKGTTNLSPRFSNRISSVKSKYTGAENDLAYLFDRRNTNGEFRCFGFDFSKVPDLGHPNWDFDNEGSSVLLPKDEGPPCF